MHKLKLAMKLSRTQIGAEDNMWLGILERKLGAVSDAQARVALIEGNFPERLVIEFFAARSQKPEGRRVHR
jgi:phage gp16-like protein